MKNILLILALTFLAFNISCKKNTTSSENTAPTASFTVNPTSGTISNIFTFDASSSTDNEDATATLEVRWDWSDDGTWDTNYSTTKTATHQYSTAGAYTVQLEVKDSGGMTNTKTDTVSIYIVVTFPDANFEALIRESLNIPIGDIMNTDLITINTLSGSDREITNIRGIEHCTNLENLYLDRNPLDDISIVSNLAQLQVLDLGNSHIGNISALSNLTNLKTLNLNDTQITDLTPLTGLINLERLWLSNNNLANLSILANLINLNFLHIANTQTTSINDIGGLTNLSSLYIFNNNITDITQLSNLSNLKKVNMFGNQIVDISALQGLNNLESININDNSVLDILPLVNNTGIDNGDSIWLENNPLSETSINTYIPQLQARGVTVHQ